MKGGGEPSRLPWECASRQNTIFPTSPIMEESSHIWILNGPDGQLASYVNVDGRPWKLDTPNDMLGNWACFYIQTELNKQLLTAGVLFLLSKIRLVHQTPQIWQKYK